MTESDITCDKIDAHSDDCTCESCQCINPKCQDNTDQCEEVQQPSERRKKMKTKLIPVMVNCAMLLLLIGPAGISVRATSVPEPIEVSSAVQVRIIDDVAPSETINEIANIDVTRNIDDIDEIHDINDISPIQHVATEKTIDY